jgi:excisionase family DNA binding protein
MNEVLTVGEIAVFLRLHPATIYKMVRRGELPAFRLGSGLRFTRARIEEWLESRIQAAESDA